MGQSYSNSGGSGDRRYLILGAATLLMGSGGTQSINYFINGSSSDESWLSGGAASGIILRFDFGANRVVTECTWTQDNATTQGTWKWQGSLDNSTYVDIGSSFTLGGTNQVQTQLNGNVTAYRYYQLLGVSGSTSSSPFVREITFKIDDIVSTVPDYGNLYGQGNRTASITVTQSLTTGNGNLFQGGGTTANPTMNLLVDGINRIDSGVNALHFITSVAVSGKWILFQFPTAVLIDEFRWFQTTSSTHGTWQFQGSNDGSSFTNIGSTFTLGGEFNPTERLYPDSNATSQFISYQNMQGPNGNIVGYLFYRLLGVSGNASSSPNIYEVAFRVASYTTPPSGALSNPLSGVNPLQGFLS